MRKKCNHYNFRPIVNPDRNDTVAYSPADNHGGLFLSEPTCIILREEALVWRYQTTYERQSNLAAMSMTGEYKIHSGIHIDIKQLRSVG